MKVVWVPRSVWGSLHSTEDFIDERVTDPVSGKTEIHVHHSAAIDDDDSTPNRWDFEEARAYVRRLQWVRPELGPLPYSECYAASEDLLTVWVFQGRGWLKRGAHTGGHNVAGVGLVAFGNFSKADVPAAEAIVEAMELRVQEMGFPNLGNVKSPRGWNAWGHRDSKNTSCPGGSLYPLLADFSLEGNNDMTLGHPAKNFGEFVKRHNIGVVPSWSPWDEYVEAGGSSIPSSGKWAFTRADIAWFWKKFVKPLQAARIVHRGRLNLHRGRIAELKTNVSTLREQIAMQDEIDANMLRRIGSLEAQVDAIVIKPGTVDPAARASAESAHARLNKYNLFLS